MKKNMVESQEKQEGPVEVVREAEVVEPKSELPVVTESTTPEGLISQAIASGASVDTMERLLAMRTQLKQEKAKELFDDAMASFQGECPVIKKTKEGGKTESGVVAYHFAPLETIDAQTKGLRQKYGFSHSFDTETSEKLVKAICIVKHKAGHSERSSFEVPLGSKTKVMSDTQVVASAITFAKRYAFCNAFGITIGDEDDDAAATKNQTTKNSQPRNIKSQITFLLQTLKADISSKEKALESIKNLTQLDGSVEADLEEIRNRLEVLVTEQNENA